MTRYLTLISGKGGVGKTLSSINLGCALNYFGKDVTVVDANLSTPNIGLYLGVPVVPINLHHALQNKNPVTEAVYQHPSGTKIVPAGISVDELRKTNPERLKKTLDGLDGTTDIVVIDGAAGLGREALAAIESSDQVLIVTNPELPAITDALKTMKVCEEFGKDVIGVLLTRVRSDDLEMSLKNVESILEKKVIGIIPEDHAIREALIRKDSVVYTHPTSKAAIGYKKLAADLIGQKYRPETGKDAGFMDRVLRLIGFK